MKELLFLLNIITFSPYKNVCVFLWLVLKFVILIVILISDSLTHILEKGLSQLIKNILGTDTKYS